MSSGAEVEVIICADSAEVGEVAAEKIAGICRKAVTPVLGLATGSSPLALYAGLARRVNEGTLDLSHAVGFALDEYVGIDTSHPQSYAQVINTYVTVPLKMDPSRVHVPDGNAEDLYAAAAAYDLMIEESGGVDAQVLGIGTNGHIGFNEPTSSFSSRTRPKTLTPQTREDNRRFFADDEKVPLHCVTQGLGTIMEARELVLVASGEHKADAIAACVEGPVSAMCPASILQFHESATVIIDEAAASKLRLIDYYTYVARNQPM